MKSIPEYVEKLNTVPPHMQQGIRLWIERGHASHPGRFLTALLSNDLMEAVGRADEVNLSALHDWAIYLYNYAPSECYGSPDKFSAWQGLEAAMREQVS